MCTHGVHVSLALKFDINILSISERQTIIAAVYVHIVAIVYYTLFAVIIAVTSHISRRGFPTR